MVRRWLLCLLLLPALVGWTWPMHGYGRPRQYTHDDSALRATGAWWYNWGPGNAAMQVPMVWATLTPDLWQYNDGRPVLVGNEPELASQANRPPAQMADTLHEVVAGGWQGEVWCCGTLSFNTGYLIQVVNSYKARYGPWPATGWHIHVYPCRAQWCEDAHTQQRIMEAIGTVDSFVAWEKLRKIVRPIIISEYGVLSHYWSDTVGWHWPADLVPAFHQYEAAWRWRVANVKSWAWFSSYYLPYNSSDLVYAGGNPTVIGDAWIMEAAQCEKRR